MASFRTRAPACFKRLLASTALHRGYGTIWSTGNHDTLAPIVGLSAVQHGVVHRVSRSWLPTLGGRCAPLTDRSGDVRIQGNRTFAMGRHRCQLLQPRLNGITNSKNVRSSLCDRRHWGRRRVRRRARARPLLRPACTHERHERHSEVLWPLSHRCSRALANGSRLSCRRPARRRKSSGRQSVPARAQTLRFL